MKDLTRKSGVSALLAADCEKAWIHTVWEDTIAEMEKVVGGDEKERRDRKMEEMHQNNVAHTIKSAEGSAGLVQKNKTYSMEEEECRS